MVIVADIGATKTVVAATQEDSGRIEAASIRRYQSGQYPSFEAILETYLADVSVTSAPRLCLGVAGIVENNRCRVTYLPWTVDGREVMTRFRLTEAVVLNDLVAAGYGLDGLPEAACETIIAASPAVGGNRALISPGTGLGEAIIPCLSGRYQPLAGEGGHADFAPFDGTTRRLWEFTRRSRPRVAVEDFLCGRGLGRIFHFLAAENGMAPDGRVATLLNDDPGLAVTSLALDERFPSAVQAVQLFWDILAAEAGNMALRILARGGIFIGGGIAPRLIPLLDKERFAARFSDKGPHEALLRGMPVKVVTDSHLPLYGAARHILTAR